MEELPIRPHGLRLQTDFITPEHEARLIHVFEHELSWPAAKGARTRLSLHYGYTFDYKTFGIDPDVPYKPFPDWLRPLIPVLPRQLRAENTGGREELVVLGGEGEESTGQGEGREKVQEGRLPDQVCLQHYPPGAGIPPHADTHSAYDELYALSLGSAVAMRFRRRGASTAPTTTTNDKKGTDEPEPEPKPDAGAEGVEETEQVELDLPPRSMMEMSGASRLHWEHGIMKRKKDVLPDGTVRPRGDRWSITYRWLRPGGVCECGDVRLCDTAQRRAGVEREYRWKTQEQQTDPELKAEEALVGRGGGLDHIHHEDEKSNKDTSPS
ncbi:hypothetical protein F4808DRAFT_351731 [Astrocystis sublimbata]|nr:hypothetical protein F4808DRAFT_351731 [Astrocystis sublimbata]